MPDRFVAMVQERPHAPLERVLRSVVEPREGRVRIRVLACGVCRTDVHLADGELAAARYPVVPGHQIVGEVLQMGAGVRDIAVGDRVGVPWLGGTCGRCDGCVRNDENLCDNAVFTGCTRDGGFAEECSVDPRYCLPLDRMLSPEHQAPLLCAGIIGYRALRMAAGAQRLGLFGFGAAAHLLAQVAVWEGREVHAFTRAGDERAQELARSLGAVLAVSSDRSRPNSLDAALVFAPVGALVPMALRAVRKGGRVILAGIHMSDLPAMPYSLLWGERSLRSVANSTRADGVQFLRLAARAGVRSHVTTYDLENAQRAIDDLRASAVHGAAVLVPAAARKEPVP